MAKTMINDLTEGNVTKRLLMFSAPFMLSNLLQICYNLIDTIIIGQYVGSAGISAVSAGGQILNFFTFFCIGLSSAGQVIISQAVGAGSHVTVKKTIGTMFTTILGLSVVLSVVGLVSAGGCTRLLNVPPEAVEQAKDYLFVSFCGLIFVYGYNTVSAILRGMGDSKHPLIFIAIASVANAILDLIFIGKMGMGASGAALATIMGQGISFAASIIFLYINKVSFGFDFRPKSFAPDKESLRSLCRLGVPMAIQGCAISASDMFVSSLINGYGVVESAVTGIGSKLVQITCVVTTSLNTAGSSMIGQNFGAGKTDRMGKTFYAIAVIGLAFAGILSAFMLIMPEQIFAIFDSDREVIAMAGSYSIIAVINFFGFAVRSPCIALVNGLGFATFSLFMGLMDGIVMRIGLALLLGKACGMGVEGFWLGSALAGLTYGVICGPYFFSGKWKKRKTVVKTGE